MILYTYIIDIIFNKQDVIYLNIIFIGSSRVRVLWCCLASRLLLAEGHSSAGFPLALSPCHLLPNREYLTAPLGHPTGSLLICLQLPNEQLYYQSVNTGG